MLIEGFDHGWYESDKFLVYRLILICGKYAEHSLSCVVVKIRSNVLNVVF